MKRLKKFIVAFSVVVALVLVLRPKALEVGLSEKSFWAHKIHASSIYDMVICGDSRTYRGVDPKILEGQTGLKAINLGFSSAGLDQDYLDFCVSKFNFNAYHKVLLIGVTPWSLTKKAKASNAFKMELRTAREPNKFEDQLFYLKNLFSPLTSSDFKRFSHPERGYFQHFYENGFASSNKIPENEHAADSLYMNNFKNDKVTLKDLEDFKNEIRRIQSSGVEVILLHIPISASLGKIENTFSGVHLKEWSDINLITGISPQLELKTYDGSHLNAESAKIFSFFIAKEIEATVLRR